MSMYVDASTAENSVTNLMASVPLTIIERDMRARLAMSKIRNKL
jgi:hypothetical protein